MKLTNIKIGSRLALGFGIVIALLIAISVLSNIQMYRLNDGLNQIVNERHPAAVLANTVQIQVNKIDMGLRDMILSIDPDKLKMLVADLSAADQKMNANLDKLNIQAKTEDDKRFVKDAIAARDR